VVASWLGLLTEIRDSMINRRNWKAVKGYPKYRIEVDILSPKSVRLEEIWLRHLLEWTQEHPFTNATSIRPTFPIYLLTARLDGSHEPFSPEYIRKIVSTARRCLKWLSTHKRGYKTITPAWLETLKPPRLNQNNREHEAVSIEEIMEIAAAPTEATWERRIKAAAVFLFLSGMRVGAFVTLPLEAVDLANRKLFQWPSMGVQTKGGGNMRQRTCSIFPNCWR
jgi:site-specific recombinase XerD